MTKELWVNLPVKDIKRAKTFFTQIGFTFDSQFGNTDHSASLVVGTKGIVVMLFAESLFKGFTRAEIANTQLGTEALFSFDAESRDEVDEMAKKVLAAGGKLYNEPEEKDGWMYGCGFIDLDGHRWNILYMDISKMPTQ